MNDKIFLDSNILIYCYTHTDLKKQNIARSLAAGTDVHISTQTLNETINVLRKKYDVDWKNIEKLVGDFESNFPVHAVTPHEITKACRIAERYKFSYFDSLIISSALNCGCTILYSEDLHNSQVIEGSIKIVNPFT